MKPVARYFLFYLLIFCTFYKTNAQETDVTPNAYNKFYYPNGQLSSEGLMKNGQPDGYWITYHVNGEKKSEGNRSNFQLDSVWSFYDTDGKIIEKIEYKFGKKNGYHLSYSYRKDDPLNTPILTSKELYLNGIKEGTSFYYYSDDGKIKETVIYVDGKKNGVAKEFSKDSIIITLRDYHNNYVIDREIINRYNDSNEKDGIWKTFFENGKVKTEASYKDGLLSGLYKEFNIKGNLINSYYYDKGQIVLADTLNFKNDVIVKEDFDEEGNLISSGPYKDDIPVGIHRFYNSEGAIIAGKTYDDKGNLLSEGIIDEEGNRQGDWKDFFLDGNLKAEGKYSDSKRTGNWKFYFENGKVEQTGNFRNGKYTGNWNWYYPDGSKWREEEYVNGRLEGLYTEFDELGNVIAEGEYFDGEKEALWTYKVGDHKEIGKYVTGLRDGDWKYYYDNGNLNFEGTYVQGNPDGKHKLYYENEILKEERIYVMGYKEKNWRKFDEEGNLIVTITYKDDKEVRINGQKIDLDYGTTTLIK